MQKILIPIYLAGLLLILSGCGSFSLPNAKWVHKVDVQQGNVVEQEAINKLRPGMTRRQVQFIMGSPLIVDTFHANRWDYLYSYRKGGSRKADTRRVALYFEDERLARIEGDLRPLPEDPDAAPKETVVEVPPQDRDEGIITRMFKALPLPRDE